MYQDYRINFPEILEDMRLPKDTAIGTKPMSFKVFTVHTLEDYDKEFQKMRMRVLEEIEYVRKEKGNSFYIKFGDAPITPHKQLPSIEILTIYITKDDAVCYLLVYPETRGIWLDKYAEFSRLCRTYVDAIKPYRKELDIHDGSNWFAMTNTLEPQKKEESKFAAVLRLARTFLK